MIAPVVSGFSQGCFDENGGGSVNYEPNSFGGPVEDPSVKEPPLRISGDADRYNHRIGNDDYSQPGALFRLMTEAQRKALMDNIAGAMQSVPEAIQRRQIEHFTKADPRYGEGVAQRLGLRVRESALTGVQVSHVLAGGTAEAGGVNARDEILGCNGWRLRRLDDAPGLLKVGEAQLRLLVSRDQRLVELGVALPPARPAAVGLALADGAQAARRRWLGA